MFIEVRLHLTDGVPVENAKDLGEYIKDKLNDLLECEKDYIEQVEDGEWKDSDVSTITDITYEVRDESSTK